MNQTPFARVPSPRLAAGLLFAAAAWLVPAAAFAQVAIADPWVRATVPQQQASGAFMRLTAAKPARLVEARSPVAGVVEIHEMRMEGDVMRMRAVPGLDLPAGRSVELRPGGYHVMLMALKQTLVAGETVPLTLVFEGEDRRRETVEITAPVRALTTGSAAPPTHRH
jgi:copper(I)-binding protein